ncbi:MAG: ATP-binding protein, partial [Bacteroidota bacterium]
MRNPTTNIAQNRLLANAQCLQRELEWFSQVLQLRFQLYFGQEASHTSIYDLPAPDLSKDESIYAEVVRHYHMGLEERLVLILALVPHVCPQLLDLFFTKNETYGRGFSEFGGIKGNHHSGFLPTGETAVFVIAANDLTRRFQVMKLFDPDHYFTRQQMLYLEKDKSAEPLLSGSLVMSREYLSYFTTGEQYKPTFSQEFPAQRITTHLDWEDL